MSREVDRYIPKYSRGGDRREDRRDGRRDDRYTPRVDRYVPSHRSSTAESTAQASTSAPAPAQEDLRRKKISHKDIKRGMLVWTTNPEMAILSGFFGTSLLSTRSQEEVAALKHWELVVEVSGANSEKQHVRTLMMTTFGSATSLSDRRIRRDRWKYLVPREPKMKECDEQPEPVFFDRGLRNEDTSGGWITVSGRMLVHADKNGQYDAIETEMDWRFVERLRGLAISNEGAFANESLNIRLSGTPMFLPRSSEAPEEKGKRKAGDQSSRDKGTGSKDHGHHRSHGGDNHKRHGHGGGGAAAGRA